MKTEADKLKLSGWVKNLSDGSVEAVLEGKTPNLQEFVEQCYNRRNIIKIDKIEEIWSDYQNESDSFDIVT